MYFDRITLRLFSTFLHKAANGLPMNNAEIPDILSKFSKTLIDKQRHYISIAATPLKTALDNDPLEIKSSKFLGNPFIPQGMVYPIDDSGNPMVLIAQINFSEFSALERFPNNGILQLYFSVKEWRNNTSDSYKIIFLNNEDIDKPHNNELPKIDPSAYENLPINKIHKLTFKSAIDTGCIEDGQFSGNFDGGYFYEIARTLSVEEINAFHEYFTGGGHKIGGYGFFTQEDPRYDEKENDIQILQIDTDEEIMFDDSGAGHIFISPEDLLNQDFSNAYFYWDCC